MVPLCAIREDKGPGLITDLFFSAGKSLSYLPVKSCHSEALFKPETIFPCFFKVLENKYSLINTNKS